MKALSTVIVLGIGFLMVSGGPARAQYGGLENALKGVGDAVMKGAADKAGLPGPGAPAAAPAAAPGSDPDAVPKVVVADAPAGAPAAGGTVQDGDAATVLHHVASLTRLHLSPSRAPLNGPDNSITVLRQNR